MASEREKADAIDDDTGDLCEVVKQKKVATEVDGEKRQLKAEMQPKQERDDCA